MTAMGALAVGFGAAFGAWLRWLLSHFMNGLFPLLPLGTLAANLVGGFLIGVALEFFGTRAGLSPELRLFAVTGFLGGLTTFCRIFPILPYWELVETKSRQIERNVAGVDVAYFQSGE